MKYAEQIIEWGVIKPYFDKTYQFNTIDIETIDNEIFFMGVTIDGRHQVIYDNFYQALHNFIIKSAQSNKDILNWTRYDNTFIFKLLLSVLKPQEITTILRRVGKITPLMTYTYEGFTITVENIIKDTIVLRITDEFNKSKNVILYNLKNLYDTDLVKTAKNYGLTYYSKMGIEYHIIDKKRFTDDLDYRKSVIESNRLDNVVLLDIAGKMLDNFKTISGQLPKSIFTNGSLARSYLLSQKDKIGNKSLNFNLLFKGKHRKGLLDYSMRSYHGGKIESYVLGHIDHAKIIDITSAYPYAMSLLPRLTNLVIYSNDINKLNNYFYAFIRCDIEINDPELIHPLCVESPLNKSNISPYGFIDNVVITKIEYDYLLKKGAKINVIDFYAIKHINEYPYKGIVETLFSERLRYKNENPSLSQMYKIILNSLYGINYELTDIYTEIDDKIEWAGYRAGDFFNPVIASYITALTRTYLSSVSHNIIENGGKIYLNMTDSIIYDGNVTMDVISQEKVLGKFETPKEITNIYILGAGRYEYQDDFDKSFTIKNRGFNVKVKDKTFYGTLDLNKTITIDHRTFVTSFKATTKKYEYEKMGYLIDDTYNIDPFNLGGKRIIENKNINLNKEYTRTLPVYLERRIYEK